MFDSILCDRSFTELPTFVRWWKYPLLSKTLPVVLLILLFFGLRWIIQRTPLRPWLKSLRGNLLLFAITATFPLILYFVADKALVAFLPTDTGQAADAIVILGRGSKLQEDRAIVAAELWQAKRSPIIFVSGRGENPVMFVRLQRKGVPKQALDGENCSATTLENAIFTTAILQPQGIRRILLVTDAPHMWRSILVFRTFGFTVIPKVSPLPDYLGGLKVKVSLVIREWLGLITYGLRGRLSGQRSPEQSSPKLLQAIQQAKQYGQQQHMK